MTARGAGLRTATPNGSGGRALRRAAGRTLPRGDESAWTELVDRLVPPYVHTLVDRGFRLEAGAAQEIVQEAFAKAFERLDDLEDDGAVRPWVAEPDRPAARCRPPPRSPSRGRAGGTASPEDSPVRDALHERFALHGALRELPGGARSGRALLPARPDLRETIARRARPSDGHRREPPRAGSGAPATHVHAWLRRRSVSGVKRTRVSSVWGRRSAGSTRASPPRSDLLHEHRPLRGQARRAARIAALTVVIFGLTAAGAAAATFTGTAGDYTYTGDAAANNLTVTDTGTTIVFQDTQPLAESSDSRRPTPNTVTCANVDTLAANLLAGNDTDLLQRRLVPGHAERRRRRRLAATAPMAGACTLQRRRRQRHAVPG